MRGFERVSDEQKWLRWTNTTANDPPLPKIRGIFFFNLLCA